MLISELEAKLKALREEHGDLPVKMETRDCMNFSEVQHVIPSIADLPDEISCIIIDY